MIKTRMPVIKSLIILCVLAFLGPAAAWAAPAAQLPVVAVAQVQPVPTAEPCGPPTLRVLGTAVNVRAGPGTDYPAIDVLNSGAVRLVAGRHESRRFWAFRLEDGSLGWVAASVVQVNGNVALVSLLPAPPLDGATPEPGSLWVLTGAGACPPTPTVTPRATATATPVTGATPVPVEGALAEDGWRQPQNLSASGIATGPLLVVGESGLVHVLWQDQGLGFRYLAGRLAAESGDIAWSGAVLLGNALPFGQTTPRLTPAGNGEVAAFWFDAQQGLWISHVAGPDFATAAAWSEPQQLAAKAAAFAVRRGPSGRLHLAVVGSVASSNAPAGVFYRRSDDAGTSWSAPASLYQSEYLRALASGAGQVSLAVSPDGGRLLVAWDNPRLERVLVTRSDDGGVTWAPASEIDRRQETDAESALPPGGIEVYAGANEALVIWQAGHETTSCTQYYRRSPDGGLTWEPAERMLASFASCPRTNEFLGQIADGSTVLLTQGLTQTYLVAWNGREWSLPQLQITLTGFANPETFRPVDLSCLQTALLPEDRLLAVGCGSGSANDVWLTRRRLSGADDWFARPSLWSQPGAIAPGQSRPIEAPELIVDLTGQLHAFWVQAIVEAQGQSRLVHSQRVAGRWTEPAVVLTSPGGALHHPTAILGPDNRIFVSWLADDGTGFFSQVDASRAAEADEWSQPAVLPSPRGSLPPAVVIDPAGAIILAYTVPVNESRGVYVSQSVDRGRTWSAPRQVFDGAAAEWERVGQPRLARSGDGYLHVTWTRDVLLVSGALRAEGLYYAHAADDGGPFTAPVTVVEGVLGWHDLAPGRDQLVHRVWRQQAAGVNLVWHQYSPDNGQSWSPPEQLTVPDGQATLLSGPDGAVYLLQRGSVAVSVWTWGRNGWSGLETLLLDEADSLTDLGLAGAIDPSGLLFVAFVDKEAGETGPYELIYVERPVLSNGDETLPTFPTPTALPPIGLTPGPSPSPTMTPIVFSPEPDSDAEEGFLSAFPALFTAAGKLIVSVAPALLVVIVAVTLGFRRLRTRR